jgi:hypothetical protein
VLGGRHDDCDDSDRLHGNFLIFIAIAASNPIISGRGGVIHATVKAMLLIIVITNNTVTALSDGT